MSNSAISLLLGAAAIAGAVASGGTMAPIMALTGGSIMGKAGIDVMMEVEAEKAKQKDIENLPDEFNDYENIDIKIRRGKAKAQLLIKTPTAEESAKLERFFKLYGYTANYHGIPNITTRETFNYLKASDLVISGEIPNNHKYEIMQSLNLGVRFWHKDFLDFSKANNEV